MIQVGSSRSMMAHTKVRIQRYVSLKNSHCWSFHSTKVMLFVQVRTERSIEFYQIMLLNIEYDMSLSRPHSKIKLFYYSNHLLSRNKCQLFFQNPMYHVFVKLYVWSFTWTLLQTCLRYTYHNDGNQKCRLIMLLQLRKCISYTNEKKCIVWKLHNVVIE